MIPSGKWFFETGKCCDLRRIEFTDNVICYFRIMDDDAIEFFDKEHEYIELVPTHDLPVINVENEIKHLVSVKYQIPKCFVKVSPNYKRMR